MFLNTDLLSFPVNEDKTPSRSVMSQLDGTEGSDQSQGIGLWGLLEAKSEESIIPDLPPLMNPSIFDDYQPSLDWHSDCNSLDDLIPSPSINPIKVVKRPIEAGKKT